jgi:ADP-ribose pyrophosphatase
VSSFEQDGSPRVVHRSIETLSRWVRLETIEAIMPGGSQAETYHALAQSDYVNVMCLHVSGDIVLVRQFRPILDDWTIEFPGGLRDGDELPAVTAMREVEEETGLVVKELVPLLESCADVGRLSNKLFGFFALVEGELGSTEIGVEAMFVPSGRIRAMATNGEMAIAANIGLIYLAGCHARIRGICGELGLGHPPWMDG